VNVKRWGTHVQVVSLDSLKLVGDIPNTDGVHGVALVPSLGRGYTSNGRANAVTVFVNNEDSSTINEFDARTLRVLHTWSIAPCEGPSGLAMDVRNRRLFSVCGNGMMAVVDANSGRLITTLPIGQGSDGVKFDPRTMNAFSANGEGTMTVVHEDAPDRFSVRGNVTTQRGARTLTLDERTGKVYTVSAEYGPTPAPTAERPRPRPPMVPGTFTLLAIEP